MKQHLEDEDLILHFYGETGTAAEPHLSDCTECRRRYQSLQRVMNSVELDAVPHRGAQYEEAVWNRLAPKLGHRSGSFGWLSPRRWVPVLALAATLVAVFMAGRYTSRSNDETAAKAPSQVRERVLLVAVGDHLERSGMLLIEIANADPAGKLDLAAERETAADLVHANRLYRQTALTAGDSRVVSLLDELERVLLEIAHTPEEFRAARLEALRERIQSQGLIFKIRVAGSRLAQEETL